MPLLTQQSYVHGVTPFYYLFMRQENITKFNYILKLTNIEVSIKFIESVIEIHDLIIRIYRDNDVESLTDEERAILLDKQIARTLIGWLNDGLMFRVQELKDIRDTSIITYDVDYDVQLGRVSLNELLNMSDKVLDEKLLTELSAMGVQENKEGEFENLPEAMSNYEQFRDNIDIAIELVVKRIERIENKDSGGIKFPLQSSFQSIAEEVESLDSALSGERNGIRDEKLYQGFTNLRTKLAKLGMDTSIQKYSDVISNMSYVVSLDKKKYNHRLIPLLETKKRILEKYRVDVISRIESLRGKNQVGIFYF